MTNKSRKSNALKVLAGTAILTCSALAHAGFIPYVIRHSTGTNNAPGINDLGSGQTELIINEGGQKAALGSNDINGVTLGNIGSISIERLDDHTRFGAGSGPYVAPYLNFWITDGVNYAVVANEPSDPGFQPLYNNGYDLSFADLSDKVAKVYENNDKSWLPNNGVGLTFADLANFIIKAPSVAELTVGWGGLGTGAPRELGTNMAYGVNWVFGDTLSNYQSGDDGYIVANARVLADGVVATPEPETFMLFSFALLALGVAGRKRAA